MERQSTTVTGSRKVEEQEITLYYMRENRPDWFPIFPHASGCWAKKIKGKLFTFGGWKSDPSGEQALVEFNRQREYVEKHGRKLPGDLPPVVRDLTQEEQERVWPGLTVRWLVTGYMHLADNLVDKGDMSHQHRNDMAAICREIKKQIGPDARVADLKPTHFEKLKAAWEKRKCSPVTVGNYITRTKIVFRWAVERAEDFDEDEAGCYIRTPVRFGKEFKKSSKKISKARNKHRMEHGGKFFEAAEIRLMLEVTEGKKVTLDLIDEKTGELMELQLPANPALKAMILLGINCGLGNMDIAKLRESHVDLEGGWLDFPRSKTDEQRRSRLWSETVQALRAARESRPAPYYREDSDRFFLTPTGLPVKRASEKGTPLDEVSPLFRELQDRAGLYRKLRGFNALRHSFETVGSTSGNAAAVSLAMGHAASGISRNYREFQADIWNPKLEEIAQHIHAWLWLEGE